MYTEIVAFFTSAIVCALLVPAVRKFAGRHRLFDQLGSSRKVHERAVPRLGGVAIVAGFYAPLLALILVPTGLGKLFYANPSQAFAFIIGGIAIAGLGLFDDLFGCGAKGKFAVQIAVAAYLWAAGFRIDQLQLPDGSAVPLGMAGPLITVIWIAGVINAMNLIDGLDGLAAGIGLTAAATSLAISLLQQQPLMGLFMAALAGSLAAFLFFNFNPASIFMGDTGSLFLGYVLAVSSVQTHQKSSAAVALFVPIVLLAVPIGDTLLAMARRGWRGRPLFSGDKEHIHHRLLALGFSQRQAAGILYGVSALFGALAVGLAFFEWRIGNALLLVLLPVAAAALWSLGYFRGLFSADLVRQRRRNRRLRSSVAGIAEGLRRAGSMDDVLESLAGIGPATAAHTVRIEIHRSPNDASFSATPWVARELTNGHLPVVARIAIESGMGHLELEWRDGRTAVDPDDEIAAERLSTPLAEAVERNLIAPGEDRPQPLLHAVASGRRGRLWSD